MANVNARPIRPQQRRLKWPLTPNQVEALDEMLETLFKATRTLQTGVVTAAADAAGAVSAATAVWLSQDDRDAHESVGIGGPGPTGPVGPAGPAGASALLYPPEAPDEPMFLTPSPAPFVLPVRAIAYNSGVQSVVTATFTALTLDSEDIDVGAMHDPGTNPSRLTVPASGDGFYFLTATTTFAPSAATQIIIRISINGTPVKTIAFNPSAALNLQLQVNWTGTMVAGDYAEVFAYQDSGGNVNVGNVARNAASELTAIRLA